MSESAGERPAAPVQLPASLGRRPLSEETRRRLAAAFPVYAAVGLAPFGPTGFLLPSDAGPFLERYYNTPVQPGDVWIVTLPKCGERPGGARPAASAAAASSSLMSCMDASMR